MHLDSINSIKGPFGNCSFYQYLDPDLVGLAQTSEFWGRLWRCGDWWSVRVG